MNIINTYQPIYCYWDSILEFSFSPDNTDRTNEILKYNQDFNLKCIDADEMICSTPKLNSTLNSSTYSTYQYFKNGEINQSVGLGLKEVKQRIKRK